MCFVFFSWGVAIVSDVGFALFSVDSFAPATNPKCFHVEAVSIRGMINAEIERQSFDAPAKVSSQRIWDCCFVYPKSTGSLSAAMHPKWSRKRQRARSGSPGADFVQPGHSSPKNPGRFVKTWVVCPNTCVVGLTTGSFNGDPGALRKTDRRQKGCTVERHQRRFWKRTCSVG